MISKIRIIVISIFIFFVFIGGLQSEPQYNGALDRLYFEEIRGSMEFMTTVQFKAFCESIKGVRVNWEGYVDDVVKSSFNDKYKIKIDMDKPATFGVFDVTVNVQKKTALRMKRGSLIFFSGRIKLVKNILGCCFVYLEE